MRSDGIFTEPLRQVESNPFRQLASVNKYQCGAVLVDERSDAVVDLVPHLMRCDGPQRNSRNFDREIELAFVTYVDDHRIGTSAAGKKMCNLLDRFLRGGETDAIRRLLGQKLQPLKRDGEVRTAFVVSDGVDLV